MFSKTQFNPPLLWFFSPSELTTFEEATGLLALG